VFVLLAPLNFPICPYPFVSLCSHRNSEHSRLLAIQARTRVWQPGRMPVVARAWAPPRSSPASRARAQQSAEQGLAAGCAGLGAHLVGCSQARRHGCLLECGRLREPGVQRRWCAEGGGGLLAAASRRAARAERLSVRRRKQLVRACDENGEGRLACSAVTA